MASRLVTHQVVKELLESDEDGTKMPERNGELISCHTLHRNSLKMEGVADVWGVHFEQVLFIGSRRPILAVISLADWVRFILS